VAEAVEALESPQQVPEEAEAEAVITASERSNVLTFRPLLLQSQLKFLPAVSAVRVLVAQTDPEATEQRAAGLLRSALALNMRWPAALVAAALAVN